VTLLAQLFFRFSYSPVITNTPDDASRGRTSIRMITRSRSFFTVGGPVVVQDGWEAIDGESCRWRRRGVWGAVNTCERRMSRDDIPSLYQRDFWVINETDICLTD